MNVHHMHLNNDSYLALKNGVKDVEVRLFDEKRQKLQLGDIIEFKNLDKESFPLLRVKVVDLLRYGSFEDLAAEHPIERISAKHRDKVEWIRSNFDIYTREQEKQFGVLGIRVQVIA